MLTSRKIKNIARNKLRGNWKHSVWISFLAVLLQVEYFPNFLSKSPDFSVLAELFDPAVLREVIQYGTELLQDKAEQLSMVYGRNITAAMLLFAIISVFAIGFILSLIGHAISLGYKKYYIDLVSKNQVDPAKVLFSRFNIFFKAIGLYLYTLFFTLLWGLLLIIPGIIAGYRYAMAPYIMAENPDIGIREAVNLSKQMMDGHKGRLFGLRLSFILWDFLAFIPLGIGVLWLNPFKNTAEAVFYAERTGRGVPKAKAEQ